MSCLAGASSFTFSPPLLVASPPLSRFRYIDAKPAPFSCLSAAFAASLASCASSSSSNFLRRLSSSLKPAVTKTSLSLFFSFSFCRSLSSTICCSAERRSTATMTFSMYFAVLFTPDWTVWAPSGTTRPTRFFCTRPSARTFCTPLSSPASSRRSSSTSSYWKTDGSSAMSASAFLCACAASGVILSQEGMFPLPFSSSLSIDSWKSAETPEALALAFAFAGVALTGAPGLETAPSFSPPKPEPAGFCPLPPGPPGFAPKPKPLKPFKSVF
mmetsp:Transcript_85896/g.152148  ORF Transcript_85896/g.152148 Transcript_85896/m.152148 type:complete len:271 (-) Transcript_85896:66-878(-)